MHRIEIAGGLSAAGLGGLLTVAQMPTPDAGTIELLLKLGSVGVVGFLFWWFMKLHFKTIRELADAHRTTESEHSASTKEAIKAIVEGHREVVDRIEKAHTDSANKFDAGAQRIVDAVHGNTSKVVDALETQARKCAATAQELKDIANRK